MPDHRQKKLAKRKKKRAASAKQVPRPRAEGAVEQFQRQFLDNVDRFRPGPCFVSRGWDDPGLSRLHCVVVTRWLDDETLVPAIMLVDLGCQGVKDAFLAPPTKKDEMPELFQRMASWFPGRFEEVPMDLAASIVLHARDYAHKLDFPTPSSAVPLLAMLEEPSPRLEISMGRRGKPVYEPLADEDTRPVVQKLVRAVGPDGFEVVLPKKGEDSPSHEQGV